MGINLTLDITVMLPLFGVGLLDLNSPERTCDVRVTSLSVYRVPFGRTGNGLCDVTVGPTLNGQMPSLYIKMRILGQDGYHASIPGSCKETK